MVDYYKGKSDSEKLVKDLGLNLELKKWSGVLQITEVLKYPDTGIPGLRWLDDWYKFWKRKQKQELSCRKP